MKKTKQVPDKNIRFVQEQHVVFMEIVLDEELRNAGALRLRHDNLRFLLNAQASRDFREVKP